MVASVQGAEVGNDHPYAHSHLLNKPDRVVKLLFEDNGHLSFADFFKGFPTPRIIVVINRFKGVTVPLDTPVFCGELFHSKIIPDEEVWNHSKRFGAEV